MPSAVLIGLVGGFACYLCVTHVKTAFGYDDSLDVFGVHCCGSIVGMLLVGILASAEANPAIATTFQKGGAVVSLVGSAGQFFNQVIAIVATALMAGLVTFVLLKIINAVVGLRVDAESEHAGLDVSEHGENAYNQ